MASHAQAHSADANVQIERLRKLGVRVTPQKVLILQALAACGGHMTADEILSAVTPQYQALNLATVYRALEMLSRLGVVTEIDMGSGATQFELAGTPHHHLVCERCGSVSEMDDEIFLELRNHLLQRYAFAANPRHLALFGLCAQCQGKAL